MALCVYVHLYMYTFLGIGGEEGMVVISNERIITAPLKALTTHSEEFHYVYPPLVKLT